MNQELIRCCSAGSESPHQELYPPKQGGEGNVLCVAYFFAKIWKDNSSNSRSQRLRLGAVG